MSYKASKLEQMNITPPLLMTGQALVNQAFIVALGDVISNIQDSKRGRMPDVAPILVAGHDYPDPWTRDAAINTWNGAGLLFPEVARNTLLAVLKAFPTIGENPIGGDYWDAIIWTIGVWSYFLYSGDEAFLHMAYPIIIEAIRYYENNEYDQIIGLFRGAAVYGDGVSAYPDRYVNTGGYSNILFWPVANRQDASQQGYGLPMFTLSTNCVFAESYVIASFIAKRIGDSTLEEEWLSKSVQLKERINQYFWSDERKSYDYLFDEKGRSPYEEGMGLSFALLFHIADDERARSIINNKHIDQAGVPCLWPVFRRYEQQKTIHVGVHSGSVWPHIQGFWAEAVASYGDCSKFRHELMTLACHAVRDGMFAEYYHPNDGLVIEGLQEGWWEYPDTGMRLWSPANNQTWSATAYLRMVIRGLAGLSFQEDGIRIQPCVPEGFGPVRLTELSCRSMTLHIAIFGEGCIPKKIIVNGKSWDIDDVIPYSEHDNINIQVWVEDTC